MDHYFLYPEITGVERSMLDAGPITDLARCAEDSGWGGIAFTEHPAPGSRWLRSGGHQTLDPFVALGVAAGVTSRLRLLTYLTVLPYRNPFLLAKSAATLDLVSGGRFVLGVGAGYSKAEFHALGVDFDERNALFDEAFEVLALHWSGEPFSFSGRHFSAREVQALPAPSGGSVPIWIGGNSQLTLRRVRQGAQGWMPLVGPPELFATTRTPPLEVGPQLTRAVHELRESSGRPIDVVVAYRPDGDLLADPDVHRAAFAQLEACGTTAVLVTPPTTSAVETTAFLTGYGERYL